MKTKFLSVLAAASTRLGRLFAAAGAVFAIGVLNPPAAPIAYAAAPAPAPAPATPVPVDQGPLTLRQAIPPDITLMLDDSGSMAWDVMPDYNYLADTSANGLTSSSVNGLYYNPNITYGLPYKADGTLYTNSNFSAAWYDGFNTGTGTTDLTTYDGSNDSSKSNASSSSIAYTTSFTITGAPYAAVCRSGWTLITSGGSTGMCKRFGFSNIWPDVCNSGDALDSGTHTCTSQAIYSFFTYTVKGSSGYTSYYVGKTGTCALAGLSSTVCSESSTVQQNVANWFSYYHTRILMAKSGLTSAFNTLNPNYRLGFGSIDGGNYSSSMGVNGTYPFTTSVTSGGRTYNYDTGIAKVAPFGNASDSASQRQKFWSWIVGEQPSGGTPLRQALDFVGQYYQTSQPWATMSTDPGYGTANQPSNIACRQAYTILTTDGFWNDTPPSTPAGASNKQGPTFLDPNGVNDGYVVADPYKDGKAGDGTSLADVAMYYWANDLRTDIANSVPQSSTDPAFWQHMSTFTIGLGFTPQNISPAGTTISQIFGWANGTTSAIPGFKWPTPAGDNINNIADLAHAGLNGHGGFFSATDPTSFTRGLKNALNRAASRVGTGASLAANSTQLQTGTAVFQANFYTGAWKGDLKSLPVDPTSGKVATTPTWSAERQLQRAVGVTVNGVTTFQANRKVWSYNTATKAFVEFKNTNDSSGNPTVPPTLSSVQLNALGATAAAQANIVNYLRGDNTLEQKNNNGPYRNRDWALGDIIDSQPVYEGAPNPNEFVNQGFAGNGYDPNNTSSSVAPFQAWAVGTMDSSGTVTPSAASQRTPLVWVTGNDGMLHGFNGSTGNEVYAYLPGALMVNSTDPATGLAEPLANLADPAYGDSIPHQFYNDGELTIADAYVLLPGDSAAQWHSILVGTTGRGPARAVYALDVTDTANIKPLWERYSGDSGAGSDYIGEVVGKPTIAQTGDFGTTPAWSVLIGNGYNSTQGKAALLQFDLANGTLYVHQTDNSTSNGLAASVAWMDNPGNGLSDYAYAGDLLGRVWSFQLFSTSGGNGNNPVVNTPTPTQTGVLLFTAKNSSGAAQPITGGMWAGLNPKDKTVWLYFGTGKYLTASDVTDVSVQSWYGVKAQSSPGNGPLSAYDRLSSSVVQRSIIAEVPGTLTPFKLGTRAVTLKPATDDMSGKNGWVIDLVSPGPVAQGERMVTPDQFQGNLLIGTTRIPRPTGEVIDPCNPAGTGWIMAVDPFTGTNPQTNFFDANSDGLINSSDTITVNGKAVPVAGVGFTSLPNAPIFIGVDMLVSFDNGTTSNLKTSASSGGYGRVSWQEVVVP